MRRHHIRIGDLTTANGVVVSATSTFFLLDKQVATEGDKIACRSCHSTGTIICIGPRIPETYEGRQVALEGDLCACRCPSPPRLIPSQGVRFQDVEGSYAQAMGGSAGAAGVGRFSSGSASERYDQHFLLINDQTGQPLEHVRYTIRLGDGRSYEGITDEDGKTDKVYADSAMGVKIEVMV